MTENQAKTPYLKRPWWWHIATWFGCGCDANGNARPASGTIGSIAALPFAYVIHVTLGNYALLAAAVIIFFVGWWTTDLYMKHYPEHGGDPHQTVVDEVAGQWLILSFLYPTLHSYLVGLFLFRLFDVVKPWPVSVADRDIHGGFGVMFDDILAALYPVAVYILVMIIAQFLGSQQLLVPITRYLGGSYVL